MKKRARVTLGTKIAFVILLSIGVFILSFGALIHFAGRTNPYGLDYIIMMVGDTFVFAAVLVIVLDTRFVSPEEPRSKDIDPLF